MYRKEPSSLQADPGTHWPTVAFVKHANWRRQLSDVSNQRKKIGCRGTDVGCTPGPKKREIVQRNERLNENLHTNFRRIIAIAMISALSWILATTSPANAGDWGPVPGEGHGSRRRAGDRHCGAASTARDALAAPRSVGGRPRQAPVVGGGPERRPQICGHRGTEPRGFTPAEATAKTLRVRNDV